MRSKIRNLFASTAAVVALMAAARLTAQGQQATMKSKNHHHQRYKVIDTGSFGGPNSHVSIGAHVLNNMGVFTGFADTPVPDPYAPDGCWDGDCLVAHTFQWKDGKLMDLGVLDGGPNSESNWISANGLIAGDSQNGLLDPLTGGWEIRGVVWKHGKINEVGTLDGGYESLARAVNSRGEVVGLSTTTIPDDNAMILAFGLPFPFQTRAYRWKDGMMKDLGTLGGPDAIALGINEWGQIIGNSYTNFDPSPACGGLTTGAFLWKNGKMVNLGSLGGTCTNASAINNSGLVVGYSFLAGDEVFHPFRWERGSFRDLKTSGGNFGFAGTLNEAGDIVGWETVAGNDDIAHATLWSQGRIIDLGALGEGQCSEAFGINARKQVVGLSGNCDFEDSSLRAFLWEPGGPMVDLNTLISPKLGVQLRNVAAINDRGEMAAVAFFSNGDHRPVLLIPCDDQRANSEDCEDSPSLQTTSGMQVASIFSRASTTWNDRSPSSMSSHLRARLARRNPKHGL